MVRFLIHILIVSLFPISAALAMVNATVDSSVLSINDSITLRIETDQNSVRPDLSALEQDFEIMSQGQSESRNLNSMRGTTSYKKTWTLLLVPKTTGQVVIPAIQLGNESTDPIHLVIHKSSDALKDPSSAGQDVFINIAIEPKEKPFVQQQLTLTIQIYSRIGLGNLSLSPLNIDDVLIEQAADDIQYQKIVNQQTYRVIERKYVLFPQKSGLLEIPSIHFEALKETRRSMGFSFLSRTPIYRRSDPIQIEISPKPDSFTGKNWLPAKQIRVQSKHSDITELKVGDSLTITDNIIGQSVLASLLPNVSFPSINGLKYYPDKPTLKTHRDNGNIVGQREEKIAIIATKPGKYTIPDRKLTWWNTQTHQMEEEIIPGFELHVQAAPGGQNPSITNSQTSSALTSSELSSDSNQRVQQVPRPLMQNPWFWSTIGVSILYLISTVGVLFWKQSIKKPNQSTTGTPPKKPRQSKEKQLMDELSRHCQSHSAKESMQSLISWANLYFNGRGEKQFSSLSELSRRIDDEKFVAEIKQLDAAIYAPNFSGKWDGKALLAALKTYIKEQHQAKKKKPEELPPLNPV